MFRKLAILTAAIMLITGLLTIGCTSKAAVLPDILFTVQDRQFAVSPQLIKNTDDLTSLFSDPEITNVDVEHWPDIEFSLAVNVDSITVHDYYIEAGGETILLFEEELNESQDDLYIYEIPHSSTAPDWPYGWNEIENRGYIFTVNAVGKVYAYSFIVFHNASHI